MRADVYPSEDTTTLYLRFEIVPEGREPARLERLAGPLILAIAAKDYVDAGGKLVGDTVVEVPIFPHAGKRNFGQARFTRHESRRAFQELLQDAVIGPVTTFIYEGDLEHVPVEGHTIRVGEGASTPA
ncbi:MAG: hypothetical protein H6806_06220 [Planctomycetes bacterium]|nr:hypothetical protein [Planctomycetota bacterium]MCB9825106.1 hypothetical protein [Planctomycetota bacterium]MCB9829337.1 hypothetical protein [Planctomycetota bacterium]MCB9902626.1 hypothetical protein [Planctomycetota bacterium]